MSQLAFPHPSPLSATLGNRQRPGLPVDPPGRTAPSGGTADDRFITATQFAELLEVSRSTFFRGRSQRLFPKETRVGQRSVRWLLSEVLCWMRNGAPNQDRWEEIRGLFGFGLEGGK